ncbi:MAG: Flp pilus assembly complex ATPase component TadA [Candidatus Omnitrophica bacterium]|nr:Flp pilus assembly complex ATPase component TadA [Candidatus Omnitrophota bacterium]
MKIAVTKESLAHELAEERKIDAKELKVLQAQARSEKKSIFQLLVEKELIKEEEVSEFLSDKLQMPLLNLNSLRIPKEILTLVPKKLTEKYQILPLAKIGKLITLATSTPFDILMRDDLKEITKCDVVFVLASPKTLATLVENYYGDAGNLEKMLEGMDDEGLEIVKEKDDFSDALNQKQGEGAEDAPVVRMVNLILDEAIRSRASDIHFEPYERNFRVRYRIDGSLKEAFSHSRDMYPSLCARVKIMSTLNITEKRIPQDGRFRVKVRDREIDFRVSILPIYYGEKIVLRVLDKGGLKSGLDKLGFSEKPTSVFAEAIKNPYGMILVTGPTGSGKSTTLYTILNTLNTIDRNIMTVEDPVEYQVEGITQTQVNAEVGLTFASGLRSLLRQSPDIVLVGEIRDGETADIGVKAALTGHLVFSTLHTNSAAGAMTRLIDMGVEPFLIASSVICVAAQRLMRKICQYCKEPYPVPEDVLRRCGLKPEDLKDVQSFRGKGCAKCNQSGYYGRMGTIEVLKMDPEIRDLVLQKKSSDVLHEVAVKKGMETLFQNAFGIFKNGLTTLEEVLRVSSQE